MNNHKIVKVLDEHETLIVDTRSTKDILAARHPKTTVKLVLKRNALAAKDGSTLLYKNSINKE